MRLREIRIQNFRSFEDETVVLGDYVCLVGPNGTGKSAVLTALNVFFRNTTATSTDVTSLTEEDFHLRNTDDPVRITLTFGDLPDEARKDLGYYVRHDQLVVTAIGVWDDTARRADVLQYGARLVVRDFSPYFAAEEEGKKVAELRDIYAGIREKYTELPRPGIKRVMTDGLHEYEDTHPDSCELVESRTQFYGWTKGTNLLDKYLQWVYVPAVKDAASEEEEGTKTALGQILKRTIRSQINFGGPLAELRRTVEEAYRKLVHSEQDALTQIQDRIAGRLRDWANQDARLALNWICEDGKSFRVNEPVAGAKIGDSNFLGAVSRLGHGMQRAFLVTMLQELASGAGGETPTLLLGFEEPELYQHPPQAQHMADLLERLATSPEKQTQVLITTHCPYFVPTKGFESIRLFRLPRERKCTLVASATYEDVSNAIAEGLGGPPRTPSSTMATVAQIFESSQKELFFSTVPILVEGIQDVAFIATHLQLTDKWSEFRRLGCHFITAHGKTNLSRCIAIAGALKLSPFVVFDADNKPGGKSEVLDKAKRDNRCIMKLLGEANIDDMPSKVVWGANYVAWPTDIFDAVQDDIGRQVWGQTDTTVIREQDLYGLSKGKNCVRITAVMERLHDEAVSFPLLDELSDRILTFGKKASTLG